MDGNESELDRVIGDHLSAFQADPEWRPDLQRGLAILRARRRVSRSSRRRWSLVAAGAAAACLPLMAFPATRAIAERYVSACIQETAAVREFLLGRTATSAPVSTFVAHPDRRQAPDFDLLDATGQHIRLSDFRGQVVLINFWATRCAPCSTVMPWFEEFWQNNRRRGFEVLGVAMDQGGWGAIAPYVQQERIDYPVLLGNDHVAALFGGLQRTPLTLVIDRSGRIAAIHAGLCRKEEYEGDINLVLSEN